MAEGDKSGMFALPSCFIFSWLVRRSSSLKVIKMNELCNELVMSLDGSDLTEIQIVHFHRAFAVLPIPRSNSLNRLIGSVFWILGLICVCRLH